MIQIIKIVFKTTRTLIKKETNYCPDFGVEITREATKCNSCAHVGNFKIIWPSDSELEKLVWEIPTSVLSKQLGVSDVAIARHCKKRGIKKPERGYWRKLVGAMGLEPITVQDGFDEL